MGWNVSDHLFICEVCGGVFPDTCPECPSGGKGVTVHTIKDHLRASPDDPSVTATRTHYGRHVATLKRSRTDGAKTSAIQIENLVRYRHQCIREGWR